MRKLTKGFTLIELLIVIALLGALAVGLLAALDPFEQLKKGTDTGTRNTVSELHGSIIRYFAVKSVMPWGNISSIGPSSVGPGYAALSIDQIISAGELKADFSQLAGDKLSNIYMVGTSENVTVCYKPLSKSMRNDPNTRYDNVTLSDKLTNDVANCGSPGDATFSCYWCVR